MADSVLSNKEGQKLSGHPSSNRGGWITFPFMIATLFGLTITSSGCLINLIVFLIEEFNIKSIAAAQIANIVNGCVSISPVVAAILADSFFGDIPVISVSAFISLLGTLLLTLIASFDYLRPKPCESGSILCQSPSELQLGILFVSLALVSIGIAGTRVTLVTAGATQYEKPKDKGNFFNWYYLMVCAGAIISATAIVYTQDNASWKLGFGLCAVINLISFIVFISGKRFYKHDKPTGSPFKSLVRVVFAAIQERLCYLQKKKTTTWRSGKMPRLLAQCPLRASALKTEGDLNPSGDSVNNIWRLCSVQEVEDFKAVLQLVPLLLANLFVAVPIVVQGSLRVLQALVMDRGLGPHFKVSAASLQVTTLICTCIIIIINNWLVYPLYQKLARKTLTPLKKIGIGQVLIILSMAISAIVEANRLKTVQNEHSISVLWLILPLVILGIDDVFQLPANIELVYGEFPETLRNTATSLTAFVIGISFYLSTALIDLIQRTTSWLPDDINHGRVDNVYWLLVLAGVLNFGYFLVCSCFYRYRSLQG